ncbi:MAG: hypothetical protein AAGH72_11410 [Verrucomicrobiota bacterium]
MWFEVALVASIFALGNIYFGHFEEGTPKWRRVAKFFICITLSVLISAVAGRLWFFVFLGMMLTSVLVIHLWWLPKHGINGWTAEPKDRYYRMRGWKR